MAFTLYLTHTSFIVLDCSLKAVEDDSEIHITIDTTIVLSYQLRILSSGTVCSVKICKFHSLKTIVVVYGGLGGGSTGEFIYSPPAP